MVSNTVDFATIIGAKIDTVVATDTVETLHDSIRISVPYPSRVWVKDSVVVSDTITSLAADDSGCIVTPVFLKPTKVITSPSVDTINAYFHGTWNSGYDTATVTVVVSYGNINFSTPEFLFPAVTFQVLPVIGSTNQLVPFSVTVPIGVADLPFSYRVYTRNSVKTDTSVLYTGRTKQSPRLGLEEIVATTGVASGTIQIIAMSGAVVYTSHEDNLITAMHMIKQKCSLPSGNYVVHMCTDLGVQPPAKLLSW